MAPSERKEYVPRILKLKKDEQWHVFLVKIMIFMQNDPLKVVFL